MSSIPTPDPGGVRAVVRPDSDHINIYAGADLLVLSFAEAAELVGQLTAILAVWAPGSAS